jgi:hypothetical protein
MLRPSIMARDIDCGDEFDKLDPEEFTCTRTMYLETGDVVVLSGSVRLTCACSFLYAGSRTGPTAGATFIRAHVGNMEATGIRKKWLAKIRKLLTPKPKPEPELAVNTRKQRKRKAAVQYTPEPLVVQKKKPKTNVTACSQCNFNEKVEKPKKQSKLSVGRFVEVASLQRKQPPLKITRTRGAMIAEPPLWRAGQTFAIVSKAGVYHEVRIHAVGLCQKGGKKGGYYRVLIVQTTNDGITWSNFDMLNCYPVIHSPSLPPLSNCHTYFVCCQIPLAVAPGDATCFVSKSRTLLDFIAMCNGPKHRSPFGMGSVPVLDMFLHSFTPSVINLMTMLQLPPAKRNRFLPMPRWFRR